MEAGRKSLSHALVPVPERKVMAAEDERYVQGVSNMGKIFISGCGIWKEKMRKIFEKAGFRPSLYTSHVDAYKKLKTDHVNSFTSGEDFIVCTGTWAYRGTAGYNGLEKMYKDLRAGLTFTQIRKRMAGCYALAYKSGSQINIVVDETHSYALYYYTGPDGRYVITNSYFHVEKCAGQKTDREIFHVMAAKTGMCGNRTPFQNIYRLMEAEQLRIDLETEQIQVIKCGLNTTEYHFDTFEEAYRMLRKQMVREAKKLAQISRNRFVFLTGGVDSRMYLALDFYLGNQVRTGYWSGGDCITNGTESDIKVSQMISSQKGISCEIFDVSMDFEDCVRQLDEEQCDIYGEYVSRGYANNKKWFDIMEQIKSAGDGRDGDYIEFGYMGESIRENATITKYYTRPYTYGQYTDDVLLRSGIFHRVLSYDGLSGAVMADTGQMADMAGGKVKRDQSLSAEISLDEADRIFSYMRLDMDNVMPNFVNSYYYCCPPIVCRPVWDVVRAIPYKYKKNDRLPLRLTGSWDRELLKIPYFSHNHFMRFQKKSMSLRRTYPHMLLSWLKPKVIDTKIYDLLYRRLICGTMDQKADGNREVLDWCLKLIRQKDSMFHVRDQYFTDGFDLAGLAELVISDLALRLVQNETNG